MATEVMFRVSLQSSLEQRNNLKRLEKSLEEKVKILKNFDDKILELIPEDEAETLINETDRSCQFSDEINNI